MSGLHRHSRAAALFILSIGLGIWPASGQSTDAPFYLSAGEELMLRAEVLAGGGVNLQWLPTAQEGLPAQLAAGFRLERYADGATLPDFSRELTFQPEANWLAAGEETAELYEDLVELRDEGGVLPQGDDDEAAFAVSAIILALDLDFAGAQLAGFAFADGGAETDRTYTYVVSDLSTSERLVAVEVATAEPTAYPPVEAREAVREPGRAAVTWNRLATADAYDAYRVERATLDPAGEAGAWAPVSRPMFHLTTEGRVDTFQSFADTTAHRDTAYAYRVQGVTCFGHYGTPSRMLLLPADPAPLVPPAAITLLTRVVDTLFRIDWALPAGADADDVAAWEVYASPEPATGYELFAGDLPPATRSVPVVDPTDGLYFRVVAVDVNGQRSTSVPKILRAVDLRPPAVPTGLGGTVDTAGVVRLTWDAGTEDDLLGYRVYVSNRDTGFFAQVTRDAVVASAYVDTVNMAMLNERVYYRVTAEDYAGNVSDYSTPALLRKPDLYPPVAPVIADFRASTEAVELDVARSPSNDVTAEVLQRRVAGAADTIWRFLADVPTGAERVRLRDTTAVPGVRYEYRVLAVDDAGLRAASAVLAAGRTPSLERALVEAFAVAVPPGTAHPTLTWRYPLAARGLRGFQVYRADVTDDPDAEPGALRLLTSDADALRYRAGAFYYLDAEARPGRRYRYRLYARYRDGGFSPLTDPLDVTVPEE